MTDRDNRDDLIVRMINERRWKEHREVSSDEVRQIEEYVIKEVMPRVYEEDQ